MAFRQPPGKAVSHTAGAAVLHLNCFAYLWLKFSKTMYPEHQTGYDYVIVSPCFNENSTVIAFLNSLARCWPAARTTFW